MYSLTSFVCERVVVQLMLHLSYMILKYKALISYYSYIQMPLLMKKALRMMEMRSGHSIVLLNSSSLICSILVSLCMFSAIELFCGIPVE